MNRSRSMSRSMVSIGYSGHRFIAYPISQAHAARGVSLINWVVEIARGAAPSR